MARKPIHPKVKEALGYKPDSPDKEVIKDWSERTEHICKPCWELKYCPYGPLVEDFPLLPSLAEEASAHNLHLRTCLANGALPDGQPLDAARETMFKRMVADFKKEAFPDVIPQVLSDAACRIFGHVCPVFFVAEPLTETKTRRMHSRYISHEVMLKVVRRDGQICQICNQPVRDDEVEFDHVIPFSKGGTSVVQNLRLVHITCNADKSDSMHHLLHPRPIEHLAEIQRQKRKSPRTKAKQSDDA
jgi:hypothetical protein